ncbi:MAG: hypothetical protein ACOZCO_09515 [Bacteroidota bacterium]
MSSIDRKEQQIISYVALRIMIGALGIALPFVVAAGDMIINGYFGFQDSVSDYHHTVMQDVFSGVLFVLGFFLFAYRGYESIDNRIANFGGLCALGVALFPNDSEINWIGNAHFISAAFLFAVFVTFSIYLFRKKASADEDIMLWHPDKRTRRKIYLLCGIAMIIFLICIVISFKCVEEEFRREWNLVYWFETLALCAFGFSWIVKAKVWWKG